ncbi:hypothetical protein HHI36_013198 [Cryptolaemus montrouzieri]|uniref:Uncharacterized protein n=1 Tax=Cryptolaemus montrouzieri TaxID=559131 RepID=A0ABD2NHL3_9CUCU
MYYAHRNLIEAISDIALTTGSVMVIVSNVVLSCINQPTANDGCKYADPAIISMFITDIMSVHCIIFGLRPRYPAITINEQTSSRNITAMHFARDRAIPE